MWRDRPLILVMHKSTGTGDDGQARDVGASGGCFASQRTGARLRASVGEPHKLIPLDLLLSVEPDNMQAQSLRQQIDRAVQRDGYIGAYHPYQASQSGRCVVHKPYRSRVNARGLLGTCGLSRADETGRTGNEQTCNSRCWSIWLFIGAGQRWHGESHIYT